MAKTTDKTEAVTAPAAEQVTLEEFCTRLSVTDKRVEMIGAFNFVEKRAGHVKDTEANYAARYEAFTKKPV